MPKTSYTIHTHDMCFLARVVDGDFIPTSEVVLAHTLCTIVVHELGFVSMSNT